MTFFIDFSRFFHIFLILSLNYEYRIYSQILLKKYHSRTKGDILIYPNQASLLGSRYPRRIPTSRSSQRISYYSALSRDRHTPSSHSRWEMRVLWAQWYESPSWAYEVYYLPEYYEFWLTQYLSQDIRRSPKTRILDPRTLTLHTREM
jgi:hypothetical protein